MLAGMGRLVSSMGVTREDVPAPKDAGQERDRIDPLELCPLEDVNVDSVEKIKAEAVLPPRAVPAGVAPVALPGPLVTKMRLSADALFGSFDKSVLKMEGAEALANFSARLKTLQVNKVTAIGHTDSLGTEHQREALRARAEAVKSYLVKQGIDGNKVEAFGKGETEPVADNATKEGRAKNRRVEVGDRRRSGRQVSQLTQGRATASDPACLRSRVLSTHIMSKAKPMAIGAGGSVDDTETSFYEALQNADLDRLMACWADEDDVVCVHPGQPRLLGLGAIRSAFEALFNEGNLRIRAESIRKIDGLSSAVHSVRERIEVLTAEGPAVAFVVATDVYLCANHPRAGAFSHHHQHSWEVSR